MSRENLFRGKRVIDGKWAESCCPLGEMHSGTVTYDFDSETVCEYTGKSDNNENKIWEEDFVKINGEWIGRVIWRDDVTAFCVFPNDDLERETYCLGFYIEEGYRVEVIGNIFDNPELLEAEEI